MAKKATGGKVCFKAKLHRPAGKAVSWLFLRLPKIASAKLPSRSKVSVKGMMNGAEFSATLEPDGEGGHWMKVDAKLRESASSGAGVMPGAGDEVRVEISPMSRGEEPEPVVPADVKKALASAGTRVKEVWADITPVARRDWIAWVESAKQSQTRAKRTETMCDMLGKGKRRPCCFDRSGMYDKSLSCPTAAPLSQEPGTNIA